MQRLLLAAGLAAAVGGVVAAERPTADLYKKSCAVCHASGAAGAPRTGVAAQWEARLAKGDDVMLASVKQGLRAMPPKGMCFDCSDAEFMALIRYMAQPAQ